MFSSDKNRRLRIFHDAHETFFLNAPPEVQLSTYYKSCIFNLNILSRDRIHGDYV